MPKTKRPMVITLGEGPLDCGSLNTTAIETVRHQLGRIVAHVSSRTLVVDLNHVHTGGASLVGLLLRTRTQLRERGCRLVLINVCEHIATVLRLCGVEELFSVVRGDDEPAADARADEEIISTPPPSALRHWRVIASASTA